MIPAYILTVQSHISIMIIWERKSLQMEPQPNNPQNDFNMSNTAHQGMPVSCLKSSQGSLGNSPKTEKPTSTYKEERVDLDITLRKEYVLDSHILDSTKITQNMRARIRSFLSSQASKQWVMRDTLALACTYIDLYFHRKGFCEIQDFQTLAIGCLILAMKMEEGKFPTISFKVFNKEDLLVWEKKIAKRLSYQLTPPTYFTFAEHVAVKWVSFISKSQTIFKQIQVCQNGLNPFLRRFYQQLDLVFMVLKSLSWPLQELVMNLFYLRVRIHQLQISSQVQALSNQQFCQKFYANDEFRLFFESFLGFYSEEKTFSLSHEQGLFLKHFLSVEASPRVFSIKQQVEDLRIWDKLQTFTKQSYGFCKLVMQKLKVR